MTPISFTQRLLSIARSQLGYAEDPIGSNKGKHVEKYLSSVGLPGGNAWCMAFVYWCVNEACKEAKTVNRLKRTGGVLAGWSGVPVEMKHSKPAVGDIFIMRFAHGTGHTGIVEKVEGDILTTIEGNTNDDGSREGYEVARRKRNVNTIVGYIRP